jgi:hypothetical protein
MALPDRLEQLRAVCLAARKLGAWSAAMAAYAEELSARVPAEGRLVRVRAGVGRERQGGVRAGVYRCCRAGTSPEFGPRAGLLPADAVREASGRWVREGATALFVAAGGCVALRECPRCGAAGLSEELAWDAAHGLCGPCRDRDDGADESAYRIA